MENPLRIVKNNELKFIFSGDQIRIKEDGTIWCLNRPILGVADDEIAETITANIEAGRYDLIPDEAWVRLGYNNNGIWAGYDAEWNQHPAKALLDQKRADAAGSERPHDPT